MLDGQGRLRRATTALGVGVAGLMLTACGSASGGDVGDGPSALAASIGGHEYTVGEVQTASRQLSEYTAAQAASTGQEAQQITPEAMVTSLVQVPMILERGKKEGLDIPSGESVKRTLEPVVKSPSQETVDFFRASQVYSQLDQKAQQQISQQVTSSDVKLSPRYDEATGDTPNWLKKTTPEMQLPGQQ